MDLDRKISTELEEMLDLFKEYYESYLLAKDNLERAEKELLDIEHKLEFDDTLAYHEYAKLGKLEAKVLRYRRIQKDIMRKCRDLHSLYKDPAFAKTLNRISNVINSCNEVEILLSNRDYTPRAELGNMLFKSLGISEVPDDMLNYEMGESYE